MKQGENQMPKDLKDIEIQDLNHGKKFNKPLRYVIISLCTIVLLWMILSTIFQNVLMPGRRDMISDLVKFKINAVLDVVPSNELTVIVYDTSLKRGVITVNAQAFYRTNGGIINHDFVFTYKVTVNGDGVLTSLVLDGIEIYSTTDLIFN